MFACTFIGHKDFSQKHYEKLYIEVENLILFKDVQVFYVGTNGAFDNAAYRVLCNLREKFPLTIVTIISNAIGEYQAKKALELVSNETFLQRYWAVLFMISINVSSNGCLKV